MNHFKSLKIGNSPLLLMGCSIISFGVTHFYFKDTASPQIANILGHILLFPVYLFEEIVTRAGFNSILSNAVIVFMVLLLTYSALVFAVCKIFEWRRAGEQ